jgi:hypothetical protein
MLLDILAAIARKDYKDRRRLLLLRLHLSMAGEGMLRIGAELLQPFAQNIPMNVQLTGGLRHRDPAFPDQLDRLNLELPTESSSLHDPPPAS